MDDDLKALFAACGPQLAERDFGAALERRLDALERRGRRVRGAGGLAVMALLIAVALSSSTPLRNFFAQVNGFADHLNDVLVSSAGQWALYAVMAIALLVGWRRIRIRLGL